ncbi:MAG: rubrerythrin family protein [Patescibacteria group bacterium]|nr:rubrerythrin family protein [Patescibacteria group bacterium]
MKTLKGTQTEKNLLKSFAGESQARMRYDYFSKQAKKDGLEQISAIFAETALNEKEHAKRFFKFLEGRHIEITATYPAGKISTTLENLKAAAQGEKEEWLELYPKFAKTAKKEGFTEIATAFKMIAKAEKAHEERYKKLYKNLELGKVFKRNKKIIWKCNNCGYLHEGKFAPKKCPACLHPQSYFQIKETNY